MSQCWQCLGNFLYITSFQGSATADMTDGKYRCAASIGSGNGVCTSQSNVGSYSFDMENHTGITNAVYDCQFDNASHGYSWLKCTLSQ